MSLIDEDREAWIRSVCNADGTEDEEEQDWILVTEDPSGGFLYYDEDGNWSRDGYWWRFSSEDDAKKYRDFFFADKNINIQRIE